MKNRSLQLALIAMLLGAMVQSNCRPRMSDQSVQTQQTNRSQSANDKQLLEQIEQFASSDENVSAVAWRNLQSHDRSKLIHDLTRIRDAAAPDDRNRALIAFTFCALGHEYDSNRKVVVSALSRKAPFKDLYGDWAAALVRRLMNQGDHQLLAQLFEAAEWSDGAMSEELASSYSQGLKADPENFLRLLSAQSEAIRNRVINLLKYESFTADEKTKVNNYLKSVPRESNLAPLARQIMNALRN